MSSLIYFNEEQGTFYLTNQHISYIMEIVEETYLVHRYWGKAIPSYHFSNRPILKKRTFAAAPFSDQPELSPEFLPFEMPFANQGDFRNTAVSIQQENLETITRFSYQSYNILEGAPELKDLPHARNTEEFAQTLVIHLLDEIAEIELDLFYTIFANSSVIIRSSELKNNGTQTIKVEKLLSASIDARYEGQQSTTFYGTHQKEFQLNRSEIQHGLFKIGSSRGASGPQYPPYLALSKNADEFQGEIRAITLLYSGNHEGVIERDQYNHLRVQIGMNSEAFAWNIKPGEAFQSPQALLAFSDQGFNGSSQVFHRFFYEHLISPAWKNKPRPIVINSWEMTYFDVNEKLMKELIDSASELGFETVVLDDGWYGKRNSSKTSLGDWQVDQEKFPSGINSLVNYAKQKNIGFGIWFEPEMISPGTQLIEAHPDWVMRSQRYEPILGRSQLFLDLTNQEVQQFIVDTVANAITEFGVNYIKWDMNRHMTDPFSPSGDFDPAEYGHRYMLGLYRIIGELTTNYPEVLFENCSSGGGRLDPGMLFYFPQTWISDNTDGLDRQQIQYGASYLFPIASMTGHVSDIPNHQTNRLIPYDMRKSLASSTNMGYELDIISMEDENKEKARKHLEEYKQERNLVCNGDFYRLVSPFDSNQGAWMFADQTKENALIYLFRNTYHVEELSLSLRIPYLDEDALYADDAGKTYSGGELAYCGLAFENPPGDFLVHKIVLKKVK